MSWKHTLAALTCIGLTACSNTSKNEITAGKFIKSALKKKQATPPRNAQQINAMVSTAMASTTAPLILISLPKHKATTVMQQLAVNGTYATYGTRDRRSITLKNGMLTATRGLGQDLMSSDVGAVEAIISSRSGGTVQRVGRYLDGENLTVALETTCTVSSEGHAQAATGKSSAQAAIVTERCTAQATQFENRYHVDASGRIIWSKQWISPLNGYITIQHLR